MINIFAKFPKYYYLTFMKKFLMSSDSERLLNEYLDKCEEFGLVEDSDSRKVFEKILTETFYSNLNTDEELIETLKLYIKNLYDE